MDDGNSGPFKIVMVNDAHNQYYLNLDTEVLVRNLTQGLTYRAVNQIGAGIWSILRITSLDLLQAHLKHQL